MIRPLSESPQNLWIAKLPMPLWGMLAGEKKSSLRAAFHPTAMGGSSGQYVLYNHLEAGEIVLDIRLNGNFSLPELVGCLLGQAGSPRIVANEILDSSDQLRHSRESPEK